MRTPDTCPELRELEVEQFGDYQDPEHVYYPFAPPVGDVQDRRKATEDRRKRIEKSENGLSTK